MARNIWLNDIRARNTRREQTLTVVEEAAIADPRPGVEVNILASQVLAVVSTLPAAQREAILLAYVEGYTCQEVADMTQVPLGTVLSRLANGRRRINEALHQAPEAKA